MLRKHDNLKPKLIYVVYNISLPTSQKTVFPKKDKEIKVAESGDRQVLYYTGCLIYLAHVVGHFTGRFARRQATQRLPLLQSALSMCPHLLFQYGSQWNLSIIVLKRCWKMISVGLNMLRLIFFLQSAYNDRFIPTHLIIWSSVCVASEIRTGSDLANV